jgi:cytidylate kinase
VSETEERLQKILARAGLGSRRGCEELIAAGRVTVDGRVVSELGAKADPRRAVIAVDGQPVAAEPARYVLLHKPVGYLSGPDPRAGYPSWQELVKVSERLFAVGRLDQDSEGLLLLTNDGELAQRLAHPRHEHPKIYLVQVEGVPNPRKIRRLQHGVMLEDGPTAPAQAELLRQNPAELGYRLARPERPAPQEAVAQGEKRLGRTSWLRITLREGRKRQARRMVGLLGHPALRVIRVSLGPLSLGDLGPGRWRDLSAGEVRALLEAAWGGSSQPARESIRGKQRTALNPSIIALDGPAASGKSTVGKLLAEELGYLYFDTGVMYRAVAAVALARDVAIVDEAAVTALAERVNLEVLPPTLADGRDVTVLADGADITWALRRPEVERAVSPVSAYAGVRRAMTAQQRRIGQAGRVVMVGRDIGTVVFPEADLKIYLDAKLHERARRRHLERVNRGEESDFDRVLAELRRRDQIDSSRQHAPLAVASDAILVDSTELTVAQVLERVRKLARRDGH